MTHQQHRRGFHFQPSYSGVYEAAPPDSHSTRVLLAPALTDGDTHPLHTSPSTQCRGDSNPAPMTCFPLNNLAHVALRLTGLVAHSPRAEYYQQAVLERLRSGSNGERLSRTSVLYNKLQNSATAWCRGHTCALVHSSHPGSTKLVERPQTHTEPASFGDGVSSCLPFFVPGCFCAQRSVTLDLT